MRQAEDVLHAIEGALHDLNGRRARGWGWGSWFGYGAAGANGEGGGGVVDEARRVYKARDATR